MPHGCTGAAGFVQGPAESVVDSRLIGDVAKRFKHTQAALQLFLREIILAKQSGAGAELALRLGDQGARRVELLKHGCGTGELFASLLEPATEAKREPTEEESLCEMQRWAVIDEPGHKPVEYSGCPYHVANS